MPCIHAGGMGAEKAKCVQKFFLSAHIVYYFLYMLISNYNHFTTTNTTWSAIHKVSSKIGVRQKQSKRK